MRVEMVEIGVQLRRLTIISIRKSYRLVCNHPFLVVVFLFLFFMYRSFPFLFSLLVSASPVVVCTAFLLGFLLSLGDPNIPDMEKEESVEHEIVSLRTEVQRDTTVVERYASTKSRDEVERLIEEPISKNDIGDRINSGLVSRGPIIEDYFTEIKSDRRNIEGVDSELQDPHMNERRSDETVFLENQYSRIEEMDEESAGLLSKSPVGSIGSVVAERGDSLPGSPWNQLGEGDDDVADEDSESDSDRAESSSPDASMADIIPMLEELHPLLNEETPVVTRGSDAGYHRSREYREIPNDSGEESENHDDMDDEEERDEKGDAKEDETKPEITWTDDDQKNVMDLGTLELERNQRLESLIARRRARKMMAEKNLMDLNFDIPYCVTPILTTKRNPFDLPYDSNEFAGLPPIPGSAPSIMSQRRNPFDLPYDSSEEKPDLTEDSFQQEFSPLPSREMMFRRHESFNVGPSIFAPPKHDRDDFRFRPFFVPEGSSHSSFRRQTSELSDISKVSSVPETDSICSVGDQDDKKIAEEDISQDVEMGSDLEDPSELVGHETELICSVGDQDNKKIVVEDISRDVEMGSDLEDPSELVGHGSESSEDEDVMEIGRMDEKETKHNEAEMPSVSVSRALSTIEEVHYSSGSSSSSLSEEHERVLDGKKHAVSSSLELEMDKVNEPADVNREPVFDLSPSSVQKNLCRSSISSEFLVDQTPETGKTFVEFSDRQIDFCTQNTEMDTHGELNSMDTNESDTSGVTVKAEQILDHGVLEYDEKLDSLEDQSQSNELEEVHVSSSSLSLGNYNVKTSVPNALVEEHSIIEDIVLHNIEDHNHSSSSNAYSDWVSVEKPMDELHFLDKPVVDSSAEDHEELLEPPTVHLESIGEDQNEDNALSEDHNFDKILEATSSQAHEANFIEEGNEVEEIDEGLLMELDNVGDFSFGKLRSSLNESPFVETRSVEDIGSILLRTEPVPMKNEAEINSGMLILQAEEVKSDAVAPSIEEVEAECSQICAETETETVLESIHHDVVDSGMHELEATSIQDIGAAFRQINDDEIEKPVTGDSLPEKFEAEVTEISEETGSKSVFEPILVDEIDSAMHELETTSIQDIDTAFQQINDEEIEKPGIVNSMDAELLPEKIEGQVPGISEETENKTVLEPIHYDVISSGMHKLEATSTQDIDTAFRQIDDEEIEKPVVVDSLNAESLHENFEAEVAESSEETENKTVFEPIFYDELDSAMHKLEATSIQDIDTAFLKIHDEKIEKPLIVDSLDAASLPQNIEAELSEISGETENRTVFESILDEEIDSAMHELEATSIQVISTASKHINDDEIEKPVTVDPLDAESLTENFDAVVAEISEETERKTVFEPVHYDKIDSRMHELQATSVQEIDTAFKKIQDEEIEKPLIVDSLDAASLPENIKAEVAEISEETENKNVSEAILYEEIDSVMHELEATSIEDINTVFRRIKEEEIEKPVAVDSLHTESLPEKNEAEVSKFEAPEPPIVEARSIENIDLAIEQHSNLGRYVTAVSGYFEPYMLEAEDIAEEINSGTLELDSTSIKNIDEAFSQNYELENSAVLETIQDEEFDSGMTRLEAQSLKDLNSVFRKIKEEIKNPVTVESLEADALKESEAGVSEIEKASSSILENDKPDVIESDDQTEEISSTIVELDAESVKDIDLAVNQIKELENSAVFEPMHAEEIDSGMKLFEARSLEDLNSAFRQINEGAIETSAIAASLEYDLVPEKSVARVSELERPELPVVEARSIEDIGLAFQQVHSTGKYRNSLLESDKPDIIKAEDRAEEVNFQMLELDAQPIKATDLAPEESEDGVSEIETRERPVVEASSIKDISLAFKQVHDSEKNNNPVIIETENEKEETNSKMVELDAQSIKDIDAAFSLVKEAEKPAVVEPIPTETVDLETKDFEARSLEDINLTFRHIKNEEVEKPVSTASLIADLAVDKSEARASEVETPELPVVEASSIKHIVLKQVHESEKNSNSISENDKPVIVEAKDQARSIEDIDTSFDLVNEAQSTSAFEPVHADEVTSGMKELEAQSLKDIETGFKQFKEEIEKPVVVESLNSELVPEKDGADASETGSTQNELEETTRMVLPVVDRPSSETEDALEPRSSLQVESENKANSFDDDTPDIESKTQGDSHPTRSNQETDHLEKQLKSNIEYGSEGSKLNDVRLSEEAETSIKEPIKAQTSGDVSKEFESSVEISSVPETSTDAKENEPNIEMPSAPLESDDLNSSLSVRKDKKGKSRKSKSGSSSSSGSSDSN